MTGSKEAILMAKMKNKKPFETADVIRGENDINTMETVPKTDPASIKEMRVTGGNTSLDILKSAKAGSIGTANRMGFNPLDGSASPTGESAVPQTKKSYSPIKNYLKKGK